ncbi:MAG: AAA family ATPase, partial [Bacteroidetes bacterium]|nr:AAA family ATPase [Bacteroidota bacterium]
MKTEEFSSILLKHFPFETTSGQQILLSKLSDFILGRNSDQIFVIKGYAGTGKTTIVRSLVQSLPAVNGKTSLLAPTGRAAKVLSNYTQKQAYTIHKKIYFKKNTNEGGFAFQLQQNLHNDTIFIVDEASMISSSGGLSSAGSLLDDLISYVFNGNNCKLILIGDTAQLPPVGLDISPALDTEFLKASYYFPVDFFELTQVVRQTENSGILTNAT